MAQQDYMEQQGTMLQKVEKFKQGAMVQKITMAQQGTIVQYHWYYKVPGYSWYGTGRAVAVLSCPALLLMTSCSLLLHYSSLQTKLQH